MEKRSYGFVVRDQGISRRADYELVRQRLLVRFVVRSNEERISEQIVIAQTR